jgi:hypothetical protein
MDTAELLGEAFYALNYIFTIRWVPSEYQALVRIYNNYRILIRNMEFISDTFDFTKEIQDTAKRMLVNCSILNSSQHCHSPYMSNLY